MPPTETEPGAAGASSPPPPPPPDGPTRRRLTRRTDDKVVAGVASGIAAYVDVDPVLVRIGFVGLTFLGGAGIPIYLIAWLLMPADDGQPAPVSARTTSQTPAFWVGIGLLVLAAFAISDQLDIFDRGILWPLLLIGVGVALWRSSQDRPTAEVGTAAGPAVPDPGRRETSSMSMTDTTAPPTPPAGAYAAAGAGSGPADPGTHEAPPTWTPPPLPPRERSILGRLTVGLALLAVGVGATLDRLDVVTFTFADATALALTVVGAGLLVGTWVGRSRALIVLGALLVPLVIASGALRAADIPTAGGFGERYFTASTLGELRDEYRLGAGEMTVDLRDLPVDGDVNVTASVGAGELVVLITDDVTVEVDADVSLGELDLLGRIRDDGASLSRSFVDGTDDVDRLVLDLQVGVGVIRLERVPTGGELG